MHIHIHLTLVAQRIAVMHIILQILFFSLVVKVKLYNKRTTDQNDMIFQQFVKAMELF